MRAIVATLTAVVLVTGTASQSSAQPTPVAVQFQMNTYETGDQARPSLCITPEGDFVVGFLDHYPFVPGGQSGQDGSGSTACLRRFSAAGAGSFEFLANTYTTGDQTDIAAACAPNGEFVIAWADRPTAESAGRKAFVGRAFNDTSLPKGNPFVIRGNELADPPPLERTAICRGTGNEFVATWLDGSGVLLARRYSVAGAAIGTEFQIASGSPRQPACCGGDAGFVVAWQDYDLVGVFARRFSAAGEALADAFLVNAHTTSRRELPDVACNDGGEFVVVWDSNGDVTDGPEQDGDGHGVFGQAFAADGSPNGEEFRANSYTTGDQLNARASMDGAGRFVVVWDSPQLTGDRRGVFAQAFSAKGTPLGSEFRADGSGAHPQSSNSEHPDVAMNDTGRFVIAWENDEDEGNGEGIFGRRYDFPATVTTTSLTTVTSLPATTTTSTTLVPPAACADPLALIASARVAGVSSEITASDALFVLRAAVGSATCADCVCDVDGNGTIAASDALLTLKKAVGQEVTLNCPAC